VDPLAPGSRARLEQERRDSAQRALSAQEEERLRIARELHDEVGQALTAVLLQLDRAQANVGGEPGERIREARETARTTLEEVRAIARNLRPEALDDIGLAAALRQLCIEAERTGVLVDRNISAVGTLSSETELVVYRVAQEAMTNALRHAGAEQIRLRLCRDADMAILRVQDDGCGIRGGAEGAGISRHARAGRASRRPPRWPTSPPAARRSR